MTRPPADPKRIVIDGYDRCARAYADARCADPSPELGMLLGRLPPAPEVLDIGCGAGVPVTTALAAVGTVTGVDISAEQIALAGRNVPDARLIHADIMAQTFPDDAFDAVVAFYALFHIPRDEQEVLLPRVARWLRPGGHFLATLPRSSHPGYPEDDFFGVTMYWSHHQTAWYGERLAALGFDILHFAEAGHGYRNVAGLPAERHPVVLARRRVPRE
jgi:SAM-dependent methyltransferase